jgi:putative hemolysin
MDPQDPFPIVEIVGIVLCLLASAFFSGSETALTAISERRARSLIATQPSRYTILEFWLQKKRRILSVLLIGNSTVNILCSVFGYRLALYFLPSYAEAVSVFGLTMLVLIFGEVTPKGVALHYAEPIAVAVIRFVWVLDKLLFVFAWPLSKIPGIIVRRDANHSDAPPVTEDEIEYHIQLGYDQSVFEEKEQGELLMSAVEFSEKQVKEVMLPRTNMVGLEIETDIKTALDAVIESGHSRIPVYRDNIDNIVGLLYAKDLLKFLKSHDSDDPAHIESIVRKNTFFAPETQKVSTLLAKMRRRGQHMAIVVDEFGGTSGLVTLEDIIEEIVGDIRDEFDFNEELIRRVDAETWLVDARLPVSDLEYELGVTLPEDRDYESVGGFVVAEHGAIPSNGTIIKNHGIEVKVLASDPRRVERVEIRRAAKNSEPPADE